MKCKTTILGLMGVVAVIAIALAALHENKEIWSTLVLALTLLLLCTATVVAVYRRGASAGFAVFGWAMFLMCQPNSVPENGPTPLIVNAVCEAAVRVDAAMNFVFPSLNGQVNRVTMDRIRVALCLVSLMFGCLGAVVGGFTARYLGRQDMHNKSGKGNPALASRRVTRRELPESSALQSRDLSSPNTFERSEPSQIE
jgi:hypothetical protein